MRNGVSHTDDTSGMINEENGINEKDATITAALSIQEDPNDPYTQLTQAIKLDLQNYLNLATTLSLGTSTTLGRQTLSEMLSNDECTFDDYIKASQAIISLASIFATADTKAFITSIKGIISKPEYQPDEVRNKLIAYSKTVLNSNKRLREIYREGKEVYEQEMVAHKQTRNRLDESRMLNETLNETLVQHERTIADLREQTLGLSRRVSELSRVNDSKRLRGSEKTRTAQTDERKLRTWVSPRRFSVIKKIQEIIKNLNVLPSDLGIFSNYDFRPHYEALVFELLLNFNENVDTVINSFLKAHLFPKQSAYEQCKESIKNLISIRGNEQEPNHPNWQKYGTFFQLYYDESGEYFTRNSTYAAEFKARSDAEAPSANMTHSSKP